MQKTVFMGQLDIVKPPDSLKTTLGSCVGVILFDQGAKVYGLAHVMLPVSPGPKPDQPGKFADTAIPELLRQMAVRKENYSKIQAKIIGGSSMLQKPGADPSPNNPLNIGARNIEVIRGKLNELGIKILAEDLGGTKGRTVLLLSEGPKVLVNVIGEPEREL